MTPSRKRNEHSRTLIKTRHFVAGMGVEPTRRGYEPRDLPFNLPHDVFLNDDPKVPNGGDIVKRGETILFVPGAAGVASYRRQNRMGPTPIQ